MAYDAFSRLRVDLPEWQDIDAGEDEGGGVPDFSPFMSSLKNRMTRKSGAGGMGGAMAGTFDSGSGGLGAAAGKAMGGGAPKSL